jgi:hypothetical protein
VGPNIDVRISQDCRASGKTHKSVIALDILNFGNLLNKKWGHIDEMRVRGPGRHAASFVNFVGIDPASGKYIYSVRDTRRLRDAPGARRVAVGAAVDVPLRVLAVRCYLRRP